MKKFLLFAGLILGLTFNNVAQDKLPVVDVENWTVDRPIYFLTLGGTLPPNQTFYGQLSGGPVGGPLAPVQKTSDRSSIFPIDATGHFDGVGIIPGLSILVSGEPADYLFEAWGPGPDRNAAQYYATTGRFTGTANIWNTTVVPSTPPQGAILSLPASPILLPIPEPSTLTLLLGGAVLIIIRLRSVK